MEKERRIAIPMYGVVDYITVEKEMTELDNIWNTVISVDREDLTYEIKVLIRLVLDAVVEARKAYLNNYVNQFLAEYHGAKVLYSVLSKSLKS
jgi:hypothetical protein